METPTMNWKLWMSDDGQDTALTTETGAPPPRLVRPRCLAKIHDKTLDQAMAQAALMLSAHPNRATS